MIDVFCTTLVYELSVTTPTELKILTYKLFFGVLMSEKWMAN